LRDATFLVILTFPLAASSGCDGRARSAVSTAAVDAPLLPANDAVEPVPRLVDGFESGALADFWLLGTYGTGLFEPGAVVVSQDYARSGRRSARIRVRQGDLEQRGDDGRGAERAELDSGHFPLLGRDVWYGFSFLIPRDFPIIDNRLVLASWKQSDVEGSPLIGQRFRAGRHSLTIRPPGASGSGRSYRLPKLRLGAWIDMVYHIRYAHGRDGRIEAWMDGNRVVSYNGPTASETGANRFYNKVGLYRDRWEQPMTMYVDNYSLGDRFDRVDPARFGRRE
jgi:hypothetical protein